MIHFLGSSFAALHLKTAAIKRGVPVTDVIDECDLIFVSEDSPVAPDGMRDLTPIMYLIEVAVAASKPIILTSQVPPGFTRSLGIECIWHQAETLRVKDAALRAYSPEQIIVGGTGVLPMSYCDYLVAFSCPVFRMSWESAEFAKVAINMTLASQVENANRLAEAAKKSGAEWKDVKKVLQNDRRIGPYSYLDPGRWQDSLHLLRDAYTLERL